MMSIESIPTLVRVRVGVNIRVIEEGPLNLHVSPTPR